MANIGLVLSMLAGLLLAGCQSGNAAGMEKVGGEQVERGILLRSVEVGGKERKYAVYVPREYAPGKAWPLVVFLHGRGECGSDGQKQLSVGLMPAVMSEAGSWPFIILCPQKPDQERQWIEHDELVMATLAESMKEWSIDTSRVYLTGLSQGGAGTWAIGARHAGQFAALAPVCGYGNLSEMEASRLKTMPLWAFHGGKDDVVLPQKSQVLIDCVKAAGGSPLLTIFPEANHNSWDAAYRTQRLNEWFLKHAKVK